MTTNGFPIGLVMEDRQQCNGTDDALTPVHCRPPMPGFLAGCCLTGYRVQCISNERLCQDLLKARSFGVSSATGAMGLDGPICHVGAEPHFCVISRLALSDHSICKRSSRAGAPVGQH